MFPIVSRRLAPSLVAVAQLFTATLAAQRPARSPAVAPGIDSTWLAGLRYRYIGPEGNRVSTVAGVAGDPDVYYAGAASGGIFKTTDGGVHWKPIFDDQPVSSIGALAVAPSDPNVVWAGTGEPFIRSHISLGWGVFRSTDAGRTWSAGRAREHRPDRAASWSIRTNPDVVLRRRARAPPTDRSRIAASSGPSDGGKTWDQGALRE